MSGPDGLHFVVPGPLEQRTGGYLYDARMVEGLRSRGWTVHVHELDGRFPAMDGRARSALDRALGDPDDDAVVVADGLAVGAAPEIVARHASGLRLLVLVHHPLADETGWSEEESTRLRRAEARTLAEAVGVVVTSPYTARRLEDFGVESGRVRTVVPGTERAPLAEGTPPGEPLRMTCVGTVTPRKGHDVLVEALAALKDQPWRCDCAGSLARDPAYVDAVRGAVEEAGLVERMRFLGELRGDVLEEVYRTADLFVLPSHYEGYGMAFAEALARGIPVVGTTGGAIPYTVPDGAGVLVPPGDAAALARALRELLVSPERRERLATAARRHARALPGWDDQADAFAQAVRELATRG